MHCLYKQHMMWQHLRQLLWQKCIHVPMKQSCGNSVGLKLENVTVEDHKTPLQTKKMSFPTM